MFDPKTDLLGFGATGRVYKATLKTATDNEGKSLRKDDDGNFLVEDDKGNTIKVIDAKKKWAVKTVSREWASSNPATAALMGFEMVIA